LQLLLLETEYSAATEAATSIVATIVRRAQDVGGGLVYCDAVYRSAAVCRTGCKGMQG